MGVVGSIVTLFFSCFVAWQSISFAEPWPSLPEAPPIPADNPQTPEKIHLGKELFFDMWLSKDGTISCASCHNVMSGGADNRAVSVGIYGQKGRRSAPTVWNSAFNQILFWDGRATSLEQQAKGPLINPIEMGMGTHEVVIDRLSKITGYVDEFSKAFPKPSLTIDNVAKAIAAYERTLVTPRSAYDRYAEGDTSAISAQAIRGMNTAASVGCKNCHRGANFDAEGAMVKFPRYTDNEYVAKYQLMEDKGKGDLTHNADDDHIFRIQTWRNVAGTAPYFHNGKVPTLAEAVRVMAKTQLNTELSEGQVADIVEFMKTLSGEFPEQTMPRLPETPGESLVDSRLITRAK